MGLAVDEEDSPSPPPPPCLPLGLPPPLGMWPPQLAAMAQFQQQQQQQQQMAAAAAAQMAHFQQQHMATEKVVDVLKEHELLTENQGKFNLPDGRSVAITDFMTIDEKKFNELSDDAFLAIRKSGALPPIYCQLISMGSWQNLVERFAVLFPKA